MVTRYALRFMKAKKAIQRTSSEYKATDGGTLFSVLSCVGLFSGLGLGCAAGLFESGVALGNGKTQIEHDSLPGHVFVRTTNGGFIGAAAGVSLGLLVAAPYFVAGAASSVAVVAAVTAVKNKM